MGFQLDFSILVDDSQCYELPSGCRAFGSGLSSFRVSRWKNLWSSNFHEINFFLVLAGSLTAEIEGISAAGATAESRRYTALADAELLLAGPTSSRKWALPPLPAGVSPALISHVASQLLGITPTVMAVGLSETPTFPYLAIDSCCTGPSKCLSTGKAMDYDRVDRLWNKGFELGLKLKKPVLLAECVPGGTTTALAVLTGLGMAVGDLVSGSNRIPPMKLKNDLVVKGLSLSGVKQNFSPKNLLAAVGDPFQAVAVGLVLGAREVGLPVVLGGGSQMAAILGLALETLAPEKRKNFVVDISIATTAWLAEETVNQSQSMSSFPRLIDVIGSHYDVPLLGLCSGLHFYNSSKKVLRDYEFGFIKEGVGAGALSLLAQINGISCQTLQKECEHAVDQLENVV